MYVCVCHAITDTQIEKMISEGQNSSDIINKLNLGESCGICLIDAIKNIEKTAQNKATKE